MQETAERTTEQRREFIGELETDLNKTIRWELGIAVVVLAVVAVLVQLTPTRGRIDTPKQGEIYVRTADAEDLFVTLRIDPNQPGSNTFEVYLAGATETVEQLTPRVRAARRLCFAVATSDGRQQPADVLRRPGPLHDRSRPLDDHAEYPTQRRFRSAGRLSRTTWKPCAPVTSDARIGGSLDSPIDFTLSVSLLLAVSAAGMAILLAGSLPRPGYPDGYLAWALEEAHLPAADEANAAGDLAGFANRRLASCSGYIVGAHTHAPLSQSDASAANPVPSTQESIDTGRMLFMNNCIQCHGETGRGDGPLASTLPIPPANLYQHIPYHPDQFFFGVMTKGLSGVMPAFENVLSETDRWNILNYLRSQFGNPEPATQ